MANKELTFSGTFLSVDDRKLSIDETREFIPENSYQIVEGKRVHVYNFSYKDNYLKVTFGDGSSMPRNPNVIDIATNETLPNPRQINQVEPKETFGLIDFNTGFLWLSDSRKKSSLMSFLMGKFNKTTLVSKDVYDEAKFIETLKRLDNIKISAAPELFSQSHTLTEKLSDEIHGYEAIAATLNFQYERTKWIGNNVIEKIKSIFQHKNNFNGIVISGRDKNDLGMLFNSEGFSRKIEFKATVDDNEMFMSDDVFNRLIGIIENENKN